MDTLMHFYVFEVGVEIPISVCKLVAFTMQIDSDLIMIYWIEFVLIYWISLTGLKWNSDYIALSKIWSKSWMS